jgi:anhydro-N-acetylmuramic acid kinase
LKILGLMSGTSLDGIDVALLEVLEEERGEAEGLPRLEGWALLDFYTRPYGADERETIRTALQAGGPEDMALLHTTLGYWFARAVTEFLHSRGIPPGEIATVGSHGQTVWHQPPREGRVGSSLQLGCPATLAELTGISVVSDFRSRDLAAGGHGAPLVPWADRLFFSSPRHRRAIQNLGGMGNVTWLPPSSDTAPVLAFDTGPGVVLLDAAAHRATGGAATFDEDGRLAQGGKVSESLLAYLMSHPFFQEEPPKSTGRELFGPRLVEEAAIRLEEETGVTLQEGSPQTGWPDLLATLTAFTARSVGEAYRRWVLPLGVEELFIMGGGARNPALREALASELAPLEIQEGQALGMDPDAREAAAFALMAWAHLRGIPANLPSATGSRGPRILGSLTPAGRP